MRSCAQAESRKRPSNAVMQVPQTHSTPRYAGMGDREAVDGVLDGNREMFEVIVRRYNPLLFRIGVSYLRNHAQAEDAMQEAYVKAYLNLSRFRRGA